MHHFSSLTKNWHIHKAIQTLTHQTSQRKQRGFGGYPCLTSVNMNMNVSSLFEKKHLRCLKVHLIFKNIETVLPVHGMWEKKENELTIELMCSASEQQSLVQQDA